MEGGGVGGVEGREDVVFVVGGVSVCTDGFQLVSIKERYGWLSGKGTTSVVESFVVVSSVGVGLGTCCMEGLEVSCSMGMEVGAIVVGLVVGSSVAGVVLGPCSVVVGSALDVGLGG